MTLPATVMRKASSSSCLVLAVAYGCFVSPANAAQVSGQFNVTATLQGAAAGSIRPSSAFCRSSNMTGSFGATVTVVCDTAGAAVEISPGSTGMPGSAMHGGAYRYLIQARRGEDLLGTIDSYVGAGTAISWRVVNLTDWYYLEMLADW